MEHEEQAEEIERDVARLEHDSDRVGEHIDDARSDWEAKEQDPSVPGAQPDPDEEEESGADEDDPDEADEAGEDAPGETAEADEDTPSEEDGS